MTTASKPTDILRSEHQSVLGKLDALEEVIERLDEREAVAARLRDLVSFFEAEFWVHFTKEEEALFPEIDKFIPRESGPVGVMLMEHQDLRDANARLQPAVADYLGGSDDTEVRSVIQSDGIHFVTLLRDHISKEDDILFVMAEMHLDREQLSAILNSFQRIEASGGKTA